MTDFLLELRSEEIPARMQDKARDDLARLFVAELGKAGIAAPAITTCATPRRLTLIARDLPAETAATAEETKGPKTSAPPQALEGFLRKTGLTREQLVERDGILFAVIDKPGRATADVLAEAIPAIVRAFPWPKSMRWGAASASTESLKWVRPLQGIVALLGEDVVPVEIAGIISGAATVGHRFHHPGIITIGSAADYAEKLRACHVIVDQDERRQIIRDAATALAADAGLELIADEGLVAENAGLTEWPVPLLGRFDAAFLDVPPEVIQLTARVNQKYFVCRSADGKLANAFICTANIVAADGGAKIVEGNRKVLAARLSDAKFFYDTDLKVPLDEQAKKLGQIVFHEKLGTVADKVDRVAKLARWLVEEGIVLPAPSPLEGGVANSSPLPLAGGAGGGASPQSAPLAATPSPNPSREREGSQKLADRAERAARLAKADLVTGMVGEFPELQGLMGGYYALAQGEDPEVAEAVRDHYKPVGQGDDVPTAPVTVAVALADKLDSIVSFFCIDERPSGSKDPFALRRASLAALSLIIGNNVRTELKSALWHAMMPIISKFVSDVAVAFRVAESQIALLEDSKKRFDSIPSGAALVENITNIVSRSQSQIPNDLAERLELFTKRSSPDQVAQSMLDFFADRLKVQQREAGVRHDLIDAVFALGGEDDLVRLLARVHALQAFVGTPDGTNLLAGYKRAANILKKEGFALSAPLPGSEGPGGGRPEGEDHVAPSTASPLSYTPEIAEAALIAALDDAGPRAQAAVEAEDFEGAMAALASLRAPIDTFFDTVIVNDADEEKRAARLALLARVRAAVHTVADFSRIEG